MKLKLNSIIKLVLVAGLMLNLALASTVGFIDVERVFSSYKVTKKAQEEMNEKLKELKKIEAKKLQELENAKIDGKTQEELEKMQKEIKEELDPKRTEFEMVYQEKLAKIKTSIVSAVESVSKEIGVDVVVDKQVIITGGIDLTDQVVEKLNK